VSLSSVQFGLILQHHHMRLSPGKLISLGNFICFLKQIYLCEPTMVAEQSKEWTVFARSGAVIVGSNPT
jgi:hypothetical protein